MSVEYTGGVCLTGAVQTFWKALGGSLTSSTELRCIFSPTPVLHLIIFVCFILIFFLLLSFHFFFLLPGIYRSYPLCLTSVSNSSIALIRCSCFSLPISFRSFKSLTSVFIKCTFFWPVISCGFFGRFVLVVHALFDAFFYLFSHN